jgi:hypothetical protein
MWSALVHVGLLSVQLHNKSMKLILNTRASEASCTVQVQKARALTNCGKTRSMSPGLRSMKHCQDVAAHHPEPPEHQRSACILGRCCNVDLRLCVARLKHSMRTQVQRPYAGSCRWKQLATLSHAEQHACRTMVTFVCTPNRCSTCNYSHARLSTRPQMLPAHCMNL